MTRTTAKSSQKLLIDKLDQVHFRVVSGMQSHTAAISEAVDEISKSSLKVEYPSGHIDNVDVISVNGKKGNVVVTADDADTYTKSQIDSKMPAIVQTTGTLTDFVMSQNAVTNELNLKVDKIEEKDYRPMILRKIIGKSLTVQRLKTM